MLRVVFLIAMIMVVPRVFAGNEVSKTYLSRVNQLLNNTHVLIDKARAFNEPTLRSQFNYKALDQDILRIQKGISDYINQRQVEPDHIKPISGEYGEHKA